MSAEANRKLDVTVQVAVVGGPPVLLLATCSLLHIGRPGRVSTLIARLT